MRKASDDSTIIVSASISTASPKEDKSIL